MAAISSRSKPLRVSRLLPARILDAVEIGVQGVRQRPVEGDAHGQNAGLRGGCRVVTSDLDLAPHHLAPARFRREKHDQVIGLANLRFNLPRPRLTDGQPLIDEHLVAGVRQAREDVTSEGLVWLGVALVTEEHARSAALHTVIAFHGGP